MTGSVVLVCGGRDFDNRKLLSDTLDTIHANGGISCIIHGDARGADRLSEDWAYYNDVPVRSFPAQWSYWGKSAGPRRNKQMLDEGKPDMVVAFPGGKGTENMVSLALNAGVQVIQVPSGSVCPDTSLSDMPSNP